MTMRFCARFQWVLSLWLLLVTYAYDRDHGISVAYDGNGKSPIAYDTVSALLTGEKENGTDAECAVFAKFAEFLAAKKLPRYEGPKPTYTENPAHAPGQGLRPGKTPLPNDAEAVFKNAVPNDPTDPTAWFGRNSDGQVYRLSADRNGTAHFSGIDGVGDGTRNLTPYARDCLNGL